MAGTTVAIDGMGTKATAFTATGFTFLIGVGGSRYRHLHRRRGRRLGHRYVRRRAAVVQTLIFSGPKPPSAASTEEMKTLVVALLLVSGCEHDPRYERHADQRPPAAAPAPAPVDAGPERTVERHGVDIPPMHQDPKIVPLDKRAHRHHRH
jgi:hypothetical protein